MLTCSAEFCENLLNLSIATMAVNQESSVGRCNLDVWILFAEARENKIKGFFLLMKFKIMLLMLLIVTDNLFAAYQALLEAYCRTIIQWPGPSGSLRSVRKAFAK